MEEFGYGFCLLAPALMCVLGGLLAVMAALVNRPADTRKNAWQAIVDVVGLVLHHRRAMAGYEAPAAPLTQYTAMPAALPEPAYVTVPDVIDGAYSLWSPRQRQAYWAAVESAQAPAALPAPKAGG